MAYYNKKIEDVFTELDTSKKGLDSAEAARRLKKYGPNQLEKKKGITALTMFIDQFKSLLVIILILAAIVAALLGERNDAMIILFVVIANAIIGFTQEFRAEKSLEALMKMVSPMAKVMRNGKEEVIDAKDIVPGDILILEEGDKVAADVRIFETVELHTAEAALTGESSSQRKIPSVIHKTGSVIGDQKNMAFMGTNVSEGRGKAIVVETGMKTEFGRIAEMTQTIKTEKTPLQKELNKTGKFISQAIVVICILVFAAVVLRAGTFDKAVFFEAFLFAVALAVAAVPEGLPATVTIALALGVKRMVKKNAIVRKLNSVETLGSTSYICSDKTGTLTKNEMTVKEFFTDNKMFHTSGVGYSPEGKISSGGKELSKKEIQKMSLLFIISALCNNAHHIKKDEHWSIIGDPTEGCLIVNAKKAGFSIDDLQKDFVRVHENPFDSVRKSMSTVHKTAKKKIVFAKGAPEEIIDSCNRILINGKVRPLTPKDKKDLLHKNKEMAEQALRVLAMAYKEISAKSTKYHVKDVENSLVFAGLVGMIDPPRPEAKPAIEECKKAGIKVVMITGDHGITARAIAQKIGLAGPGTTVLEGKDLPKISDEKLFHILKAPVIFARVSPKDKLRIVNVLESRGFVVAVTGDGVNDAPALKKASIGVAMGIVGTDVSKEASEMVLTDDSFASIVTAIEEGRSIYDDIQKFLRYLLSSNLGEIFTVFFGLLLNLPLPILATQILWVNLVTDLFPALALGVEPAEKGIMARPPRKPHQRMITKAKFFRWMFSGIVIATGVLGLFIYYLHKGGWFAGAESAYPKALTISFTTLVIYQLVNVYNCRSEHESVFKLGFF
jgi:Ca2+-transporting ATPase